MRIRLGTRGSDLALWQARFVAEALRPHADVELVVISTRGDRIADVPLHEIPGQAFFTAEIERALLDGEIDLAVHSHKDLARHVPPGLLITAVPARGPAGELLLVRPAAHDAQAPLLPLVAGARVGTSAPRRTAALLALRPDLVALPLRGNVPTRVARLREGRYDAVVLAAAGLARLQLDLADLVSVALRVDHAVPAPAQGALAVQARAGDEPADVAVRDLCQEVLHDAGTSAVVAAERSLLEHFGGGCNLPLGAHVEPSGNGYRALLFVGPALRRTGPLWMRGTGADPGQAVQAALGAEGHGPLAGRDLALVGSAEDGSQLGAWLAGLGARVTRETVLRVEPIDAPELPAKLSGLASGDGLVFTSRRAVARLGAARPPAGVVVGAVGPATAAALRQAGWSVDVVGAGGGRVLAEALPVARGATVLHPCGEESWPDLARALDARGARVERVVLYRTVVERRSRAAPSPWRVYTSPSAVRAALELGHDGPHRARCRFALGAATQAELRDCGLAHEPVAGSGPLALVSALLRKEPAP